MNNCPICNGTGKLEKPYLEVLKDKKKKRSLAKKLLKKGYSIRQTTKMVGYGSTRSVFLIAHIK